MIPKKLASCLAALLAACCLLSVPALAVETGDFTLPGGPAPKFTQVRAGSPADADNDALFSAYISGQFFAAVNDGVSPASVQDPAGDRLVGVNKAAYDHLKTAIKNTAQKGGSAVYTFTSADLKVQTEWTLDELKALNLIPEDFQEMSASLFNKIVQDLYNRVYEELNSHAVESALLVDCPFDLYWFDKTGLMLFSLDAPEDEDPSYDPENCTLSMPLIYSFYFTVAEGYQGSGNIAPTVGEGGSVTDPGNPVVTSGVERVQTAVITATTIVNQYKDKNDYDRLLAYKNEICARTAYNHDAADAENPAYGDPWQLIYVFDGVESTNVVCEGYAKAFQYLCDLTLDFQGDVDCYIVDGTMSGGTGAGLHMWNIVRLEGKSYLVDVTNSDAGSIGAGGGLFLAGTKELDNGGYVFRPVEDRTVTYQYNREMSAIWGDQVLTLEAESYQPTPPEKGNIGTVTPQESGGKLSVSVSVSVDQPSWLLAAAYGGDGRLANVFPVYLETNGDYTKVFNLPDGTRSFKVLLTGGKSWAPLCGAGTSGSK